ncbi:hypothetical protein MMC19_001868 [Ptychographa xylographoides]|nr:hypothetical protein [Ptychographa xylographoides]
MEFQKSSRSMEYILNDALLPQQDQVQGFTPVRRRDRAPATDSPATTAHPPWTTARCNRLLRPLSSRVSLLRKHRECLLRRAEGTRLSLPSLKASSLGESGVAPLNVPEAFWPQPTQVEDPDWTPELRPGKRLRRTYSARSGSLGRSETGERDNTRVSVLERPRIQLPVLGACTGEGHTAPGSNENCRPNKVHDQGSQLCNGHCEAADTKPPEGEKLQSFSRDSFRKLAKLVSPSEWMLDDGLYTGLDALLKATGRQRLQPTVGARSLLRTCLRRVPDYIAEEQRLVNQEDEDTITDIAASTYADLEAFCSVQATGWKPLREVVRAHGITILGDGIEDGSIRPPIARGLVKLCLQASAFDEAESLVDRLLKTLRSLPEFSTESFGLFAPQTSMALQTLWDLADRSKRWGFLYSRLDKLLSNRSIPADWISSQDMVICWNRVIESITQQDDYAPAAVDLVRTVVALSYRFRYIAEDYEIHNCRLRSRSIRDGHCTKRDIVAHGSATYDTMDQKDLKDRDLYPGKALFGTVTSIVTVLLSVALVRSETSDLPLTLHNGIVQRVLLALALDSCRYDEATWISRKAGLRAIHAAQACLPLLVYAITQAQRKSDAGSEQLRSSLFDILSSANVQAKSTGDLSSFLCAVASCSEQAGIHNAFQYMQSIVQWTLDMKDRTTYDTVTREQINRLALQSAFEFAEQTNQRKYLDWALELEENMNKESPGSSKRHQVMPAGRPKGKAGTGFRWEEGLCEWVAKTPATSLVKPVNLQSLSESSESEDEEPIVSIMGCMPLERRYCLEPSELPSRFCFPRPEGQGDLDRLSRRLYLNDCRGRKNVARRFLEVRIFRHNSAECHETATQSDRVAGDVSEVDADENGAQKSYRAGRKRGRPRLADVTNLASGLQKSIRHVAGVSKGQDDQSLSQMLKWKTAPSKRRGLDWTEQDTISEDELGI